MVEKRLLAVSLILLCFWATEGILHLLDSPTTTTAAVGPRFLPGIGVTTWKEVLPRFPWGTIVLFGAGIGLGTALLQTEAVTWRANLVSLANLVWLSNLVVTTFGLHQLGALAILARLGQEVELSVAVHPRAAHGSDADARFPSG